MSGLNGCRKTWMKIQGEYHRWEIQHNPEYFQRVSVTCSGMRSWRGSEIQQVERPALSFITQDEIDAVLRRGGITAGGRNRIYEYFMEHHDTKEAADFLKNEYGTGGSSPGIIGAYQSDASHDAKGLRLSKGKIGNPDVTVLLKWNKVAERVRQLVRSDDYLSPEEMEKYEERQEAQRLADLEEAQQALNSENDLENPQEEPVHEVQEQEDTTESLEETVFNESEAETESPIQQLEEMVPAGNFHITDDELGQGTAKEKVPCQYHGYPVVKEM